MFTELAESARELRNPLAVGYGILFLAWLLFYDSVSEFASNSAIAERMLDLVDDLGSVSGFALLTFLASVIGSPVWNMIVEPLVKRVQAKSFNPDWGDFVEDAKERVKAYEEYAIYPRSESSFVSYTVTSAHYASTLAAEVDRRSKRVDDVTFRMTTTLVGIVCVALPLTLLEGCKWWFSWVIAIPLFGDVTFMREATRQEILDYQITDKEARRDRLEDLLTDASRNPNEKPPDQMELQDGWRSEANRLKKEIADLDEQRGSRPLTKVSRRLRATDRGKESTPAG